MLYEVITNLSSPILDEQVDNVIRGYDMAQQACTKPKPKPKPKLLKGFEPLTPRLGDPTRYHCAMKPLGCNNARFPMPEPNFASKPAAPRHKIRLPRHVWQVHCALYV